MMFTLRSRSPLGGQNYAKVVDEILFTYWTFIQSNRSPIIVAKDLL